MRNLIETQGHSQLRGPQTDRKEGTESCGRVSGEKTQRGGVDQTRPTGREGVVEPVFGESSECKITLEPKEWGRIISS